MTPPKLRASARDYWETPESVRSDLIDGELHYHPTPNRIHQHIVGGLMWTFDRYLEDQGITAHVHSRLAVNLYGDETTFVEPDVLVVCDLKRLSDRGCEGAPDLIVEVISPEGATLDLCVKPYHYHRACVREYWVVDPVRERTLVHERESDRDHPDLPLR